MAWRECAVILATAASLGLAACHHADEKAATNEHDKAPVGATGKGGGTNAMGGPGSGLAGGMNPAPGQGTGVSEGSTNSTPKNAVGSR
jgi:hypothetical protein